MDVEFGGEASPGVPLPYTRANGAFVRRMGPVSLSLSVALVDSFRFGRVMAQFSQGPARLVVVSSYVLR